MTWSETHRIPAPVGQDIATFDAFFAYFADTYLPSKGWLIEPSANGSDWRQATLYLTSIFDGSTYAQRMGLRNLNGTLFVYTDPSLDWTDNGDSLDMLVQTNANAINSDYVFWTSDQDANAALITRGKYVSWYWPGSTGRTYFGAEQSETATLTPMCELRGFIPRNFFNFVYYENQDVLISPYTLLDFADGLPKSQLIKGFHLYCGQRRYPDRESVPILMITSDDVLLYLSSTTSSTSRPIKLNSNYGEVWQLGSNYYFSTANGTSSYSGGLVFDVGTTEPTL